LRSRFRPPRAPRPSPAASTSPSRGTNDRSPIQQASPTGSPLFSRAIDQLAPGQTATIDVSDFGHPIASLRDLPAGTLLGATLRQRLHKFARADGHTVWLHMDQWEGQNWKTVARQSVWRAGADEDRPGVERGDQAGGRQR
jgi:hypothetical protein